MHGGAKMTKRSDTVTNITAFVLFVLLIIAIVTPLLTTEASIKGDSTGLIIGMVGSAIVLILGLGFSFLIEQNEEKEEKIGSSEEQI